MGMTDAQEHVALAPPLQGSHPRPRPCLWAISGPSAKRKKPARGPPKQATRACVSAWSTPVSRKLWLLRGKPLPVMAKAELQAKMGDQLAVMDKVVPKLHALSGFEIQDYVPKNLQGTRADRDIISSERFDILVRALMEMLTTGLPQQSSHRNSRRTIPRQYFRS